jgi:hypothetical protein
VDGGWRVEGRRGGGEIGDGLVQPCSSTSKWRSKEHGEADHGMYRYLVGVGSVRCGGFWLPGIEVATFLNRRYVVIVLAMLPRNE